MSRLYSALKYLRYTDRLDAIRDRRIAAPVHVRIKPTNLCNHKCWYCAYRSDDLKLGEDMDERDAIPADKMFEIVDDLIDMGVKAVTFSGGGEPLLYKPLPEVIERLAAGGVRVATLTNGANLRGRAAAALARCATWVRVSVDAWDDASYATARGIADGQFSRLLENMRAFADMGAEAAAATGRRCELGVSFIISKENRHRIAEACALFKAAGAGHVKLSGAVVSNDVAANNAYHREIADAVAAQIAEARGLAAPGFALIDHYHETNERFQKDYAFCPYLQFLTVIGADLKVYTCQDKAYTRDGELGSIAGRRLRDFWFSEENRQAIYGLNPSITCGHHCVSHAKNLSILEYLSLDPEHGVFV